MRACVYVFVSTCVFIGWETSEGWNTTTGSDDCIVEAEVAAVMTVALVQPDPTLCHES